jgi:hypothetical protein
VPTAFTAVLKSEVTAPPAVTAGRAPRKPTSGPSVCPGLITLAIRVIAPVIIAIAQAIRHPVNTAAFRPKYSARPARLLEWLPFGANADTKRPRGVCPVRENSLVANFEDLRPVVRGLTLGIRDVRTVKPPGKEWPWHFSTCSRGEAFEGR